MYYYANFDYAPDGITVTFRDIPEAITCGFNDEEAMFMAEDALLVGLEFYFEDERPIPLPSKPKKGEKAVYLPDSVFSKVLLHNAMIEKKVSNAALARAMNATPAEVQRIVNVRHKTKIDTIGKALNAIGFQLQMSI
ncbi:MAG: type II toxin-antitoxin system HicB family antitoxin [Neisseriaceae bacterium]|nr:type II toxin-antitoxin system HicB family antitoxin [Neisseriaceae bacterium]